MKNNIIKDDREISMKSESLTTDVSDNDSTATDKNLPIETFEMNNNTLDLSAPNTSAHPIDMVEPTEPMTIASEPITDPAVAIPMNIAEEPIVDPAVRVPMNIADEAIADPAAAMQSSQTELTALFENTKSTAIEFFNNNRQVFITAGWILLAIFGIKVVFATLGIIDDIPLVTPLIKLVGLVSVVRFAWRYLIREHDRQELIEIIDRKKVEVLGDRQSLS
jgi:CAAD domains of cyanobacterial aminoacyl-tRNA synthetase